MGQKQKPIPLLIPKRIGSQCLALSPPTLATGGNFGSHGKASVNAYSVIIPSNESQVNTHGDALGKYVASPTISHRSSFLWLCGRSGRNDPLGSACFAQEMRQHAIPVPSHQPVLHHSQLVARQAQHSWRTRAPHPCWHSPTGHPILCSLLCWPKTLIRQRSQLSSMTTTFGS
jgi:hypothetical protein